MTSQSRTAARRAEEHPTDPARFNPISWWRQGRGLGAEAILDSLDPAVVARGRDGLIRSWNAGAERLYGFSANEMIGRTSEVAVPSTEQRREREILRMSWLAGFCDRYETRRVTNDGAEMRVAVEIAPVKNAAGSIVGVSTLEQELGAEDPEQRHRIGRGSHLDAAFQSAPIATALVSIHADSAGSIIQVDAAFCEISGYSPEELETMTIGALLHPEDAAADVAAMRRLDAAEMGAFQLEQRLLHRDRHALWVTADASLVRDLDGVPVYCIRQLQNIDERKRYEGELAYLVEHDPLTGVLNRRGFMRELTHEMAYSRRYGGAGAVLLMDLDDFKWVNDTLGHDKGDELISEVSRLLGERLRETDALARLGGDEFAVLLPQTEHGAAQTLSRSLATSVSERCSIFLPEGRRVTLSVGVNPFDKPSEDVTAEDILADADSAMYAAKDAGKDRVALATTATHNRGASRVTWAERVRRAVHGGRFELFCQPILDLRNDEVSQWELLLRMPGDEGELILPSQFLYTAERSGLILEIDRWVLGEALELIAAHREAGRNLCLEVNISGRSIGDPNLLTFIERGLEGGSIDPQNLILEVTETAAIANMDRARGFAMQLQSLGCRFALDDFGAGFGSFYYLKHIPFDFVKVDGEFIRNLPSNITDQLILDSIVQMAKGLEKHTIAEFVSDRATVAVLKQRGVDYAQGFHLGRPVPVSEALAV